MTLEKSLQGCCKYSHYNAIRQTDRSYNLLGRFISTVFVRRWNTSPTIWSWARTSLYPFLMIRAWLLVAVGDLDMNCLNFCPCFVRFDHYAKLVGMKACSSRKPECSWLTNAMLFLKTITRNQHPLIFPAFLRIEQTLRYFRTPCSPYVRTSLELLRCYLVCFHDSLSLGVVVFLVLCHFLNNSLLLHGLTIVAFGNGAPDIFSAVAAFTNSNPTTTGVAIGALLGKSSEGTTWTRSNSKLTDLYEGLSDATMRRQ